MPLLAWLLAHATALCWWVGDLAAGENVLGVGVAAAATALAWRRPRTAPLAAGWVLAVAAPLALRLVATPYDSVGGAVAVVSGAGLLAAHGVRCTPTLAALWLLALPVGDVVDALLGFTLRTWLASGAAAVLGGVPVETVLRLEGGAAHVDAPCAGLGGLWMLAEVVLLARVAFDVPAGLRSAAAAALAGVVYLGANLARIVVIVGLAHRCGLPFVAELVHVPLGIVGFAAALGAYWGVAPAAHPVADPVAAGGQRSVVPAVALAAVALVPVPSVARVAPPAVVLPMLAVDEPDARERAFAARVGATIVEGHTADARVAVVLADAPLAHHAPTQCLSGSGWVLSEDAPAEVGGLVVRRATAVRGDERAVAWFWFESADRTTPDLAERVRDGLLTGRRWALVSILSRPDAAPDALVAGLHDSVRSALRGAP